MRSRYIFIDIRADGYGVVYDGKTEIWPVDLETCIGKLRGLVAGLADNNNQGRYDVDSSTTPGFPSHHIRIDWNKSFGIKMGYWLEDGTAAFGGISSIWPHDVDGVLSEVKKLLELMHRYPNTEQIPLGNLLGLGDEGTW